MSIEVLKTEIATALSLAEATLLSELAMGKAVLEVGAHYGFSTVVLGQAASSLVSVDNHRQDGSVREGALPMYLWNLERHGLINEVTIIVAPSERALPLLRTDSFDLIFIDGDHEYQAVKRDLKLARPLLRRNGRMAFHDYGPEHFGVKRAVDELCGGADQIVDTLAVVQT